AGVEPHAIAADRSDKPIAVVFDLVNPCVASGRLLDAGREHWFDEFPFWRLGAPRRLFAAACPDARALRAYVLDGAPGDDAGDVARHRILLARKSVLGFEQKPGIAALTFARLDLDHMKFAVEPFARQHEFQFAFGHAGIRIEQPLHFARVPNDY